MSERKFSRSFDMPTVDPDKEDESKYEGWDASDEKIEIKWDKKGRGNKIAEYYKAPLVWWNGSAIDFEDEIEDTHEPYVWVDVPTKKTAKEILEDRSRAHVCKHEWKMYTGLSEQFEYCVHCDEKRK